MAPKDILEVVRRRPFEPFRLVLADGAKYDINHADQCMVMKKSVVIGEASPDVGGFIEWTININCWNVIRIEKAETPCLASV
jgi:hypothetical protein